MEATPEQISLLQQLQEHDRRRLRAKLALENLPQPAKIAAVRSKREAVQAKFDQIETLRQRQDEALEHIGDEDAQLVERQKETQAKIDELQGDYRSVNSLTRDLEGIAKRRETLEFESTNIMGKLDEISVLASKVAAALEQLSAQEAKLSDSYGEKAVELKRIMEDEGQAALRVASDLPRNLLAWYRDAARLHGGIGIALLEEGRCGACRNVIEENRLLQIRREAPLSTCPHCGRILIVE
ncbi:zinc ribbon domain-containing protein [Curtanaerobium respiraculi]|uniref:zinc ribbon domain-containing protein n=1 Tax=Curtanaerobium respiraculi TaxID=2949669 RepID=UPI0024B354F6|nr:C4-type zinc ribbon domain-containing protein [Curtanaerobium respiraculi]